MVTKLHLAEQGIKDCEVSGKQLLKGEASLSEEDQVARRPHKQLAVRRRPMPSSRRRPMSAWEIGYRLYYRL